MQEEKRDRGIVVDDRGVGRPGTARRDDRRIERRRFEFLDKSTRGVGEGSVRNRICTQRAQMPDRCVVTNEPFGS